MQPQGALDFNLQLDVAHAVGIQVGYAAVYLGLGDARAAHQLYLGRGLDGAGGAQHRRCRGSGRERCAQAHRHGVGQGVLLQPYGAGGKGGHDVGGHVFGLAYLHHRVALQMIGPAQIVAQATVGVQIYVAAEYAAGEVIYAGIVAYHDAVGTGGTHGRGDAGGAGGELVGSEELQP